MPLKEQIANYITNQFIGEPKEFPSDECLHEATVILALVLAEIGKVPIESTDAYDNTAIMWFEQGAKAQVQAIKKQIEN